MEVGIAAIAGIAGTVVGALLGAWLQRNTARQLQRHDWAVQLRRQLSIYRQLLVDMRSALQRADHGYGDTLPRAWDYFHAQWASVRGDAITYLGLVPAVSAAIRGRILDRSSSLENAVESRDRHRVLDAIGSVMAAIDEAIDAIDSELGVKES